MYDDILGSPDEEIKIRPKRKEMIVNLANKPRPLTKKSKLIGKMVVAKKIKLGGAPTQAPTAPRTKRRNMPGIDPTDAMCPDCGEEWEDCECPDIEDLIEDLDDDEEDEEDLNEDCEGCDKCGDGGISSTSDSDDDCWDAGGEKI